MPTTSEGLVVDSPGQLTTEFLSAHLGAEVLRFEVAPVQTPGVNGDVQIVTVWTSTSSQQRLVAKFPPADARARAVVQQMNWNRREIGFFQELASQSPLAPPPGTCLHAAIDVESGSSVLLLRHLSDQGWRQGDQVDGCSAAAAATIVATLAEHHARWWAKGDCSGTGELPSWLPRSTNLSGLEAGPRVQRYLASVWNRVRDRMPVELRPVGDALADNYAGLMQVAAQPPTTLVHGDLRLDNLFVLESDGSDRWCAIDWQFVGQQRGTIDLAYFVGLSLTPSVRAAAEDALLLRSVSLCDTLDSTPR